VKFVDALEGWAVGAEGTIIHTTMAERIGPAKRSGTDIRWNEFSSRIETAAGRRLSAARSSRICAIIILSVIL
jgi:hypothetical protein